MKSSYFYIMASKKNGVIYVGMTAGLKRRVFEHRNGLVDGFTKEYYVHRLVYFEKYNDINDAIKREKCVKKWRRGWKIELIEKDNSDWEDLYSQVQ